MPSSQACWFKQRPCSSMPIWEQSNFKLQLISWLPINLLKSEVNPTLLKFNIFFRFWERFSVKNNTPICADRGVIFCALLQEGNRDTKHFTQRWQRAFIFVTQVSRQLHGFVSFPEPASELRQHFFWVRICVYLASVRVLMRVSHRHFVWFDIFTSQISCPAQADWNIWNCIIWKYVSGCFQFANKGDRFLKYWKISRWDFVLLQE